MKKKIAALILVIVALLSVFSFSASADDWKARFWVASYDYDQETAADQSFIIDSSNIKNAEGNNVMQYFQYVYGAICEWDDAKGAFVITKSDKWNAKTDWVVPENGFFFMVAIQGESNLATYDFGQANYEAAQTFVDDAAAGQTIYFYGVDFANRKVDATEWNKANMSGFSTKAYATLGAPDAAAGEAATLTASSIGHSSFSYPEAATDNTTAATTASNSSTTTASQTTKSTESTTKASTTSTTKRASVVKTDESSATKTGETDDKSKDDTEGFKWWIIAIISAAVVIVVVVVVIVVKKKKGAVDAAIKAGKNVEKK